MMLTVSCGLDTYAYIPVIDENDIDSTSTGYTRSFSYELDSSSYTAFRGFIMYYKIYPGSIDTITLDSKIETDKTNIFNNPNSPSGSGITEFGLINSGDGSIYESDYNHMSLSAFRDDSGGSFTITEDSRFTLTFSITTANKTSAVNETDYAVSVILTDTTESITSVPLYLCRVIPTEAVSTVDMPTNFAWINVNRSPDITNSDLSALEESGFFYLVLYFLPYGWNASFTQVPAEEASALPPITFQEGLDYSLYTDY